METPKYIGPYRVDSRLGAGGMGVVYRAYDDRVGRTVAIKRLVPGGANADQERERLRREGNRAASLDHPAIVEVSDVFDDGDAICIAMEYVNGTTLRERIVSSGCLPVRDVLRLGMQIADGMASAHEHGIIHRGLDSENVLVDRSDNIRLIDVGMEGVGGDDSLVAQDQRLAFYKVLSPEQIRGEEVTGASALFCFGVLLYEALTGEHPFTGTAPEQIAESITNHRPPSLSTLVPEVPEALAELVERLLQKQPTSRPSSFREVFGILDGILNIPGAIGPYRVEGYLGEGGMGQVFLGHHDEIDRPVAIKRLVPKGKNAAQERERFRREGRAAARIDHPSVIKVFDVFREGDATYIVMEHVQGGTLRQRIVRHGPLSVREAVRIGLQIAEGMAEAHKNGIIHRDLKSENVLLHLDGTAKITDFGIAKVLGAQTLTEQGRVLGTYTAMSPEQIQGKDVTEASDLFSYGILLYEALTGERPFRGGGLEQIVLAIRNHQQPSLSTCIPGSPRELSALVDQLLLKHPSVRPHDFREVIEKLTKIEAQLDDATAALTAPSVQTSISEESTEDPAPPVGNDVEPVHAATPEDPQQALVLSPLRDSTSRQLAASESSVPVPTRVPRWRKRLAALAAAILVLAGLAYALWPAGRDRGDSGPRHNLVSSRYIAVLRPEIAAGCMHDVPLVRRSIRYEIEQELHAFPSVELIPDEDSSVLQRNEMSLRQLVHALDANELLVTHVDCYPAHLTIQLRRINATGVQHRSSEPFDMDVSDIGVTSSILRRKVRDLYAELGRLEEAPAETDLPSSEDLETFQRLRQDYWKSKSRISDDELLHELARILERTPTFLEAYLFAAEVEEYRHRQDQDLAHLRNAQALLEKALLLAPPSKQKLVRIRLFSVALGRGDIQAAGNELNKLENDQGRNATSLYLRALLTEKLGDPDGARQLLQEAASRHPSWRTLYHQARLDLALGDIAAAEQYLYQLFERSPGNDTGLQLQWELELITRPRDAVDWYYLLPSTPSFSMRANHAVRLMSIGEYSQALDLLEVAHEERPKSLPTFHNLAEAWKLVGDTERAADAFEDMLAIVDERDGGPSDDALRAQLLAHLGRTDEARQSIERAITQASPNIRVHYAAAATYALIGEPDRAAQCAIRALDGGYAKEWFHYPWFEAMRESPLIRDRF